MEPAGSYRDVFVSQSIYDNRCAGTAWGGDFSCFVCFPDMVSCLLFVLVRLLAHFDLGSVDESVSSVLHASEKIWLVQGEKRYECHIVSRTPFPFAGGMVLRCGSLTLILSDREVVVMEKHRCAGILKGDLSVRMDAVMKKEENMVAKDARVITEGVHPVCLYGRIRLSSAHCQFSLLYSHLA